MWFFALLLPLVAAAIWAFYKLPALNAWCRDSEILAWAAIKTAVGGVATLLLAFDPADFKNAVQAIVENIGLANWWPVALAVLGLALYFARKLRDPAMKG